ncbi:MAG: type II toxin-antitoxin system RelE family toxin [Acidimicrobiales bacterium]
MTSSTYRLVVAATAERSLARLPEAAAAAIVELMVGSLVHAPRRVGHPPQRELAGLWSVRRGSYRVVYEIDNACREVSVLRIDHRSDVYRPR